jgi:arginyl-tRNA synthetase
LAKAAAKKPRDIAEPLLARLKANPDVVDGAVAGPGFINLKITDSFWRERLRECLEQGIAYGDSPVGAGAKVNVEYVSANPTGPLHVAHARGAVVGDALANLLAKAGRPTCAIARRWAITSSGFPKASIRASISRKSVRRSPSATARAGSTSPRPTGCPRCAPSPSPP